VTAMAKLTELEGCVLGLVWELGSCTPYAIRRVFQASPNPQWSGSAGAIYPLVRKLDELGLLKSRADSTGERKRTLYSLSSKGQKLLRAWLRPPVLESAVSIPLDPLRIRVRFLAVLSKTERATFLAQAEEQLVEQGRDARREHQGFDREEDPYSYLIARGVEKLAQARLGWIREVRALLE